jgi:hypothetical protein
MKYMMLINAASADATSQCTVEDWMVYDKQVTEAGIVAATCRTSGCSSSSPAPIRLFPPKIGVP